MNRIFSFFILSLLLIPSLCYGFKLTPMVAKVEISGKEARTSFQLENDSDKSVPIQIIVTKRVVDLYGKEKYPPAGEDFLVYPTQVILSPGEKRTINVRYMAGLQGEHKVEKAYRVIAEQLPLPLGEGEAKKAEAGINVLLRYIAALYVTPKDEQLRLEVESFKILKGGQLQLTLHNLGSVHQILENHGLKISWKDKKQVESIELQGAKELAGLFGENILAAHQREFILSNLSQLKSDGLKVELIAASKKD